MCWTSCWWDDESKSQVSLLLFAVVVQRIGHHFPASTIASTACNDDHWPFFRCWNHVVVDESQEKQDTQKPRALKFHVEVGTARRIRRRSGKMLNQLSKLLVFYSLFALTRRRQKWIVKNNLSERMALVSSWWLRTLETTRLSVKDHQWRNRECGTKWLPP